MSSADLQHLIDLIKNLPDHDPPPPEALAALKSLPDTLDRWTAEQHRICDARAQKALQDLEERENRLAIILDGTVDGFITINEARQITSFNRAAEKIFGYKAQEVLGQNVKMLMPEPYHSHHDRYVQNYLTGGVKKIIGIGREVVGRRKSGATFPLLLGVSEAVAGDERIFVGCIQDISQRKEQELALRKAKDLAEAASRSKSEFLANMSHEIRTPMNAIMGLSQLALNGEMSPKLRDYLGKISDSAKSLLGIINDILDFSKIEAGKLTLDERPFDLIEILTEVGNILSVRAREKEVELLFAVDSSVPRLLLGDSLRLGQVLTNLAGNAIKFTERGEVTIAVNVADPTSDPLELIIKVKDNGIGMSPEQIEKIFQPFTQADGSFSRKYGGTGLGLSIVDRLVKLMGGRMEVASEPAKGSIFTVICPLGRQARATADYLLPASDLQGLRVPVTEEQTAPAAEPSPGVQKSGSRQAALPALSGINSRAALDRLNHDQGLFFRLLGSFIDDYRQGPTALKSALEQLDYAQARLQAHTLKGAAATVGAEKTAALTQELEQLLANSTSRAKIRIKLNRFTKELDKFLQAVAQADKRGELPAPPLLDRNLALSRLNNDQKFLASLLVDFCHEYQGLAPKLITQEIAGEYRQLSGLLFTLRGTADSLGATPLTKAAWELEELLRTAPDREKIDRLLAKIEDDLSRIVQAEALLPAAATPPPEDEADREELKAMITDLPPLLRSRDLTALTRFAELKKSLGPQAASPLVVELERQIKKLDFNNAATTLEKLNREL
ncbi:ATP-binding protein [Desulfurivibrio dismutans]|uniref:ATP-binding protein n=1 Tax=Desulfurivibrio dismutans TaxID=1398908 RepID=UPI0023DC0062|nr:ATP-binding protein [Desulfurivibrio alkaliphilus]MDF1613679.1 ATP-binding protein [Desulfurivibrio alkaliphilus]